ncbi:MAG: thiamine pyrophosphate-dependent enzyme [Candidatus Korobacteraceae bacterium]|jgi:TPP-dependent pyruvate/acetoin dehydrogenase alpha subunit
MATKVTTASDKSSRKTRTAKPPLTAAAPQTANRNGSSARNGETLRKLYAALLRCRLVQERVLQSHSTEYELALGDEAVTVGTTAELGAEDTVAASLRNLAALVARGVPLKTLLGDIDSPGDLLGSITRLSLPDDPFNMGTGIALAHKLERKQNVVVAFCDKEVVSLDPWHGALKFAGVHKLPIVYVVKSSAASGQPSASQPAYLDPFSFMARDCGFPGIVVDGKDVVAVWRVAQESIQRARQGSGPTLIDCRTESARDPLQHMEHYMRKRNVWDDDWRNQIAARINCEFGECVS